MCVFALTDAILLILSFVYLQPEDVLFAQSDAMQSVFSVVVSYRELSQITPAVAKILDECGRKK